uniref:Uncharacterized protein n=1 Tax=viral metagenome TaxID=1070528 RepID=A0A6M3LTZ4_9ZZZZ
MDNQYIEMYDHPLIQDGHTRWDEGDNFWLLGCGDTVYSFWHHPIDIYNSIWLPTQEQLQDIVGGDWLLLRFIKFCWPDEYCEHADPEAYNHWKRICDACREKRIKLDKTYPTIKLKWLGFAMHELHQMTWENGWVKEV